MFFCNPCKIENNWPGNFMTSYGKCEMCEMTAPCYDVPSKYLPAPEVVWDTLRIQSLAASLAKTMEFYKVQDPTYNSQLTVDFITSILAHNDIEVKD
jgi:hypothetical protein